MPPKRKATEALETPVTKRPVRAAAQKATAAIGVNAGTTKPDDDDTSDTTPKTPRKGASTAGSKKPRRGATAKAAAQKTASKPVQTAPVRTNSNKTSNQDAPEDQEDLPVQGSATFDVSVAPSRPSKLLELPNELLLKILEGSRNPWFALVSRRFTDLLGFPEMRKGIIREVFRNPGLESETPNATHRAMRKLYEEDWFSYDLLLDTMYEWLPERMEEIADAFIDQHVPVERVHYKRLRSKVRSKTSLVRADLKQACKVIWNGGRPKYDVYFTYAGISFQMKIQRLLVYPHSVTIHRRTFKSRSKDKGDWQVERFPPKMRSGAVIPDIFLTGPWTQEQGNQFYCMTEYFDWRGWCWDFSPLLTPRQRQLSGEGLLRAIRQGCIPILCLFTTARVSSSDRGALGLDLGLEQMRNMTQDTRLAPWTGAGFNIVARNINAPCDQRHVDAIDEKLVTHGGQRLWETLSSIIRDSV